MIESAERDLCCNLQETDFRQSMVVIKKKQTVVVWFKCSSQWGMSLLWLYLERDSWPYLVGKVVTQGTFLTSPSNNAFDLHCCLETDPLTTWYAKVAMVYSMDLLSLHFILLLDAVIMLVIIYDALPSWRLPSRTSHGVKLLSANSPCQMNSEHK